MTHQPTTAVLRTAPGRGGIAVITLVGPQAEEILDSVFKPIGGRTDVAENELRLGHLADDAAGATLDKVIVCKTPRGVEINIHGGPHIARRSLELLAKCGAQPTNRPAETDEPLDATHSRWNNPSIGAELLRALPRARSSLAVAALSTQWSGGLSELVAGDEPPEAAQLRNAAAGLSDIEKLLNPADVVLAGPPNAGKSTLTNALVGREVSIVHQTAGTTRDWVRESAVVNGVPIRLTDTAGLWDAAQGVDAESVRRARHCAAQADILILMTPDERTDEPDWLDQNEKRPVILSLKSKCDQPSKNAPDGRIEISAMTGQGIAELKDAIVRAAELDGFDPKTPRAFTPRQAAVLTRAADEIDAGNQTAARTSLNKLLRGPIN